ncbi:MAG: HAMP domain-containing sensor histidine kinase [Parafilimonas sp.]
MKRAKNKYSFGNLYWRLSAAFLAILTLIGVAYVYITIHHSAEYFEKVSQLLNRNVATQIVKDTKPFKNGKVDTAVLEEMFRHAMAVNPSLEIYLLDTQGKILAHSVPENKIILEKVDLKPVTEFISNHGTKYITDNDPRDVNAKKVFSAAPVVTNKILDGYIYIVLASEEYDAISQLLSGDYLMQVGLRTMILTLLAALLIGLVIFRVFTRNHRKIIEVMQKFRKGDINARIEIKSTGDTKQLADSFNEMANILTQNLDKVNAIEMLRRELIANISHDLKTPVSVIQGYAETLQMKELTLADSDRRRYINTILQNTQKLEKLVNELFELSKLEANQVVPKKEPFSISELLNDMYNKYQLIAKEKNISLETELSKDLPPVYADVSLIERVMQNLIDNAIKFTPEGGMIMIRTHRYDNHVEVIITDSGIGIPESEQDKIFTRYYRTTDNFMDLKESAGLGLTIAKRILELHNSSLTFKSKENIGSSFSFSLPVYKTK